MERRKNGIKQFQKGVKITLISKSNPNTLTKIIRDKNNKQMVLDLLTIVLNLNINQIHTCQVKKFEDISEYEFSLINTKVSSEDGNIFDVYLRVLDKEKIKENIFCYWCLLYEDERKRNDKKLNTIISKVTITEIGRERYKNSILLDIPDNNTNILQYGSELHFIDFIKYIDKNRNKNNKLEKWLRYIDHNSKDILLIGMTLNKWTSRSNIEIV